MVWKSCYLNTETKLSIEIHMSFNKILLSAFYTGNRTSFSISTSKCWDLFHALANIDQYIVLRLLKCRNNGAKYQIVLSNSGSVGNQTQFCYKLNTITQSTHWFLVLFMSNIKLYARQGSNIPKGTCTVCCKWCINVPCTRLYGILYPWPGVYDKLLCSVRLSSGYCSNWEWTNFHWKDLNTF